MRWKPRRRNSTRIGICQPSPKRRKGPLRRAFLLLAPHPTGTRGPHLADPPGGPLRAARAAPGRNSSARSGGHRRRPHSADPADRIAGRNRTHPKGPADRTTGRNRTHPSGLRGPFSTGLRRAEILSLPGMQARAGRRPARRKTSASSSPMPFAGCTRRCAELWRGRGKARSPSACA